VPVQDRTEDTLLACIKKWIMPGTTIISDCWKSYNCLNSEGFQHLTVNHTYNFVDPDTGNNFSRQFNNYNELNQKEFFDTFTKLEIILQSCVKNILYLQAPIRSILSAFGEKFEQISQGTEPDSLMSKDICSNFYTNALIQELKELKTSSTSSPNYILHYLSEVNKKSKKYAIILQILSRSMAESNTYFFF